MLNANFLADKYIKVMPELARAVAEPLGAVDNITMYGDGNAAKLVEETTKMTSQVNNGLADSLGIDLKAILSGVIGGTAAGHAMKEVNNEKPSESAPVINGEKGVEREDGKEREYE